MPDRIKIMLSGCLLVSYAASSAAQAKIARLCVARVAIRTGVAARYIAQVVPRSDWGNSHR